MLNYWNAWNLIWVYTVYWKPPQTPCQSKVSAALVDNMKYNIEKTNICVYLKTSLFVRQQIPSFSRFAQGNWMKLILSNKYSSLTYPLEPPFPSSNFFAFSSSKKLFKTTDTSWHFGVTVHDVKPDVEVWLYFVAGCPHHRGNAPNSYDYEQQLHREDRQSYRDRSNDRMDRSYHRSQRR